MYVVQEGQVEVVVARDRTEVSLAVLGPGELFGEMALCDGEVRSATVRAIGEVRALTVDGSTFLRRVHEDPSLALRVVRRLAKRLREMNNASVGTRSDGEEPRAI
jgi:CRP-like cAMP-binding protein